MRVQELEDRQVYGRYGLQERSEVGLDEEVKAGSGAPHIERQDFLVLLALPPFSQAAARLGLLLQDVQVLVREDLDDLQEPLLACQALAHNAEQQNAIEEIMRGLTHLHETAHQSLEAMMQCWQKTTNWTAWQA